MWPFVIVINDHIRVAWRHLLQRSSTRMLLLSRIFSRLSQTFSIRLVIDNRQPASRGRKRRRGSARPSRPRPSGSAYSVTQKRDVTGNRGGPRGSEGWRIENKFELSFRLVSSSEVAGWGAISQFCSIRPMLNLSFSYPSDRRLLFILVSNYRFRTPLVDYNLDFYKLMRHCYSNTIENETTY